MKSVNSLPLALILIALLSFAAVLAGCLIGPADFSLSQSLSALFGGGTEAAQIIVREIRLPRALAAWAAGAALGASGAALQGLLRNPLADPGVLGVSAASALGAVIAIYFNLSAGAAWATPLAAILFALGATAILYVLGAGRVSPTRLILIGGELRREFPDVTIGIGLNYDNIQGETSLGFFISPRGLGRGARVRGIGGAADARLGG